MYTDGDVDVDSGGDGDVDDSGDARFSPDDKFSRQRVLLKKRFGLLPTQKPPKKY
ncbi:hypothetical protein R6Q57_004477 [Mikania cordata]